MEQALKSTLVELAGRSETKIAMDYGLTISTCSEWGNPYSADYPWSTDQCGEARRSWACLDPPSGTPWWGDPDRGTGWWPLGLPENYEKAFHHGITIMTERLPCWTGIWELATTLSLIKSKGTCIQVTFRKPAKDDDDLLILPLLGRLIWPRYLFHFFIPGERAMKHDGGTIVAETLFDLNEAFIHSLWWHISPILAGCTQKALMVDVRNEANAVCRRCHGAFDRHSRCRCRDCRTRCHQHTDCGKNAQLAQSPVVLLGSKATVLRGRGSRRTLIKWHSSNRMWNTPPPLAGWGTLSPNWERPFRSPRRGFLGRYLWSFQSIYSTQKPR